MKILILGARGQLGHDLAQAATLQGFETVASDKDALDLRAAGGVRQWMLQLDFDVVVNCAAYTAVDAAETEPEAAFAVNAYAAEAVAQVCRASGRPLVHMSTDYVFNGEHDRPYQPHDAPGPINVYGASKLVGEALARRAHPDGSIIVRTSSVFGVAGAIPGGTGNFVETMLRVGAERRRLRVVADAVMAPTYSRDLARGILDLVGSEAPPGIYHMTNDGTASWWEFAREIFRQAGMTVEVDAIASDDYAAPARRPRYTVLDTGATTARVGRLPPWREALERYLTERTSALP